MNIFQISTDGENYGAVFVSDGATLEIVESNANPDTSLWKVTINMQDAKITAIEYVNDIAGGQVVFVPDILLDSNNFVRQLGTSPEQWKLLTDGK